MAEKIGTEKAVWRKRRNQAAVVVVIVVAVAVVVTSVTRCALLSQVHSCLSFYLVRCMFKCYNVHKQAPFYRTRGSTFYRKLRTLKQKIGEHRPDFVDLVMGVLVLRSTCRYA